MSQTVLELSEDEYLDYEISDDVLEAAAGIGKQGSRDTMPLAIICIPFQPARRR